MVNGKILIVDDDPAINELIATVLKRDGKESLSVHTAREAMEVLEREPISLILLDIGLPDLSGIELCETIREKTLAPIIFISGRDGDENIIRCLTVGGDDYITKPFSLDELSARVAANLRRAAMQTKNYYTADDSDNFIKVANIEVDMKNHCVYNDGKLADLSIKEFELLKLFMDNPGKIFNMEEIFQLVWGHESYGDTRVIMVHISNLRKKIESDSSKPKLIVTVRGVGYKFVLPEP